MSTVSSSIAPAEMPREVAVDATKLVILLFPGEFPQHRVFARQVEKNAAFQASGHLLRQYFERSAGVPGEQILEFASDTRETPAQILDRLFAWIVERSRVAYAAGRVPTDVIFVYVGHGAGDERDYSLLLPISTAEDLRTTALHAESLVVKLNAALDEVLSQFQIELRLFLVIDACYAGRIAKISHPDITSYAKGTLGASSGIAALCSSVASEASRAPLGWQQTLFSTAFYSVLTGGPQDVVAHELLKPYEQSDLLTLSQVRELISGWLRKTLKTGERSPPTADALPLKAPHSDPRDVPLFRNPLRHAMPRLPPKPLPRWRVWLNRGWRATRRHPRTSLAAAFGCLLLASVAGRVWVFPPDTAPQFVCVNCTADAFVIRLHNCEAEHVEEMLAELENQPDPAAELDRLAALGVAVEAQVLPEGHVPFQKLASKLGHYKISLIATDAAGGENEYWYGGDESQAIPVNLALKRHTLLRVHVSKTAFSVNRYEWQFYRSDRPVPVDCVSAVGN